MENHSNLNPNEMQDFETLLNKYVEEDLRPCVVLNENTLGCAYKNKNATILSMLILQGDMLNGGHDWKKGSLFLEPFSTKSLRFATLDDFKRFKVHSDGYFIHDEVANKSSAQIAEFNSQHAEQDQYTKLK